MNALNGIRDAVAKESGLKPISENYRDQSLATINVRGIIPLVYGKFFSGLNGCSYTVLNDFVIFANEHAALKSLIDEIEESKVLSRDKMFSDATAHFGESGNVRLFVNPQFSVNLYRPSILQSFLTTLYGCSGIHAQWDYKGGNIRSKMLFDFHKKTMKEPV